MNVCLSFFQSSNFLISWLGRITRWQLFNPRTTRHINCHKNKRNAGTADILWESDLLRLTLRNFIFLFTSFVHLEKKIIKQILLLSNSTSSNLVSWPGEKAYFTHTAVSLKWVKEHDMLHVICPGNESFCFMALKTRHVLRKLHSMFLCYAPLCLNGRKNTIYIKSSALEMGCFASGL